MGKYLLNKETQKIEMHFSKAEYMALSDNQKSEIKSKFLWSKKADAWVSRSTNNHYWALKVAENLGLENAGSVGEQLSYAEQLERKSEKAELRAERYEQYSENASKRAENLQADFNHYRKDWSWLTQPIIAGHSGSRAFANHKNKVMARYERGFDEYKKSEYYQDRAATARATANNEKLNDKVYLHNRIKECNKNIKRLQDRVTQHEQTLYKITQGETLYSWDGKTLLTAEGQEKAIESLFEKYEYEQGKLEFFEDCMEKLGGVQFSQDNIEVGYIVNIKRWGRCEVTGTGSINFSYKILTGGAAGLPGKEPYEAIIEVLKVIEAEKIVNPYKVGDILTHTNCEGNRIIGAWQVVKTTDLSVKIQKVAVENNIPIANNFISNKPILRKIVKSKFSNFVGVYESNWQLHKYTTEKKGA